jgi:quinol monooxygenase YgiN
MPNMYIRLAQGNVDPSRLDAYVAHVRTMIPNTSKRPGFRNAYHAVNRERARSVIITIWDSQEQAPAGANAESVARLQAEFGLQPEEIVGFEVMDQV